MTWTWNQLVPTLLIVGAPHLGWAAIVHARVVESARNPTEIAARDTTEADLATAPDPGACAQIAYRLFSRDVGMVSRPDADANLRKHMATCGRRFDPLATDAKWIGSLVNIYDYGALDDRLFVELDRSIGLAKSDSARATEMLRAVGTLVITHGEKPLPDRVPKAESYVAAIDTMSGAPVSVRMQAHEWMATPYDESDPAWTRHVDRAYRVVDEMTPAQRATADGKRAVWSMYEWRARRFATEDNFAAAIAQLDSCLAMAKADSTLKFMAWGTERTRRQLALVGKPAPIEEVAPAYWINAPTTLTKRSLKGRVTLLEFNWTG